MTILNTNIFNTVIWFQVFLSNTNPFCSIILFKVTIPVLKIIICLHIVLLFQRFPSNTNNLQANMWFQVINNDKNHL